MAFANSTKQRILGTYNPRANRNHNLTCDPIQKNYVPLGLSCSPDEAEHSPIKIHDDKLIGYELDSTNLSTILVCAKSGCGKGRLTKNMIKAYHKNGYKILYIDAKSTEFLKAKKKGEGHFLHPSDQNETLPVVGYAPSFVKSEIDDNLNDELNIYSNDITSFKKRDYWNSLGFTDKSSDWVLGILEEGGKVSLGKIEARLNSDQSLMPQTKVATQSAIDLMKGVKFFNPEYKPLDIKKEWDRGNIVSVSYFSRDGALTNTDVGALINQVKEIGSAEYKLGSRYVTPKLIVFDDAFYYLTKESGVNNLAIKNVLNLANNYRLFGMNMMIQIQSPNLIDFKIVESCSTLIIGKLLKPNVVNDLVSREAFKIISSKGGVKDAIPLVYKPKQYLAEWMIVQDGEYERFFPYNCTLGHGE